MLRKLMPVLVLVLVVYNPLRAGTAANKAEVLLDAPLVLYPCDEASGNLQDASGNGRHCTAATGTTYHVTGPFESGSHAISWAGAGSIVLPTSLTLPAGSPITVEWWQNVPTGSAAFDWFKWTTIGSDRCQITSPHSDNNVYWDYWQGVDLPNGRLTYAYSSRGAWHHMAVRSTPGGIRDLLLDGVVVATGATNSSSPTSSLIGGTLGINDSGTATGSIAAIVIYNQYLTTARIASHYAAGVAPVVTGYTISQPASGINGAPSTVTLTATPAGAYFDGSVTATLTPSGTGGSAVTTTPLGTTATVQYTPASTGTATLTATNNGSLSNPAAVTFTVYGAPTGKVDLLGTAYGSGAYTGNPTYNFAKLFDGDFSTFFVGADDNAYAGIDLGVACTVTDFLLAPRPSTNDGALYDKAGQYFTIDGGTGQNTSLTTYFTGNPCFPFAVRNQLTRFSTTSPAAKRCWQLTSLALAGNVSELHLLGPWAPGCSYKPIAPTISPAGGHGQRVTETMASETTSSAIYYTYTSDGSAPATPTSSSTLYVGPRAFAPTTAGLRFKAIAIDPASAVTSDVTTSGVIVSRPTNQAQDEYDDEGHLIEAHDGFIMPWQGVYYRYGSGMNRTDLGDNVLGYGGFCYSSKDGQKWHKESQVCDTLGGLYVERLRVQPNNPVTHKFVLWCISYGADNGDAGGGFCLTSDTPNAAKWTIANSLVTVNGHGYQDATTATSLDGASCYLASVPTARDGFWITKLNSTWTDTTTTAIHLTGVFNYEAPILRQMDSTHWLLIYCPPDFYDPTVSALALQVVGVGADPTTAVWPDLSTGTPIYAVDPLGTINNGQTTCLFQAFSGSLVLHLDRWDPSPKFGSRYIWATTHRNSDFTITAPTQSNPWPYDDPKGPAYTDTNLVIRRNANFFAPLSKLNVSQNN